VKGVWGGVQFRVAESAGEGRCFFGESAAFVEKTAPNTLGVISAVPLAELRLHFFTQVKKVQKKHLIGSIFTT